MRLHQHKVAYHHILGDSGAYGRVGVVAVYAAEFNRSAVELDNAAVNYQILYADFLAEKFVYALNQHRIEIRSFRRPQARGTYLKFGVAVFIGDCTRHCAAVGVKQRELYVFGICSSDINIYVACAEIFRSVGGDEIILDMTVRAGEYVYVTENARGSEFVLIFKI